LAYNGTRDWRYPILGGYHTERLLSQAVSIVVHLVSPMSTIITYTSTFDPAPLVACLPDAEGITVHSLRDLAVRVVNEQDVRVVIVQDRMTEEVSRFLSTLKRSFPRLDVVVITENADEKVPPGILRLDGRMELQELRAIFHGVCGIIAREQRNKARFDWPLKGRVSLDGDRWQTLSVRSLSASGAFLEYEGSLAESGTTAELRTEFLDSTLRTRCEILDVRPPTASLPRGFGVRFIGLPHSTARSIDAIVRDALLTALLQPGAEQVIPTLAMGDPALGTP
jgi:hypothetical protein